MSDVLTKLKGIGAQKIHEQTHIATHHAQALLYGSFEDMTKIQFTGFISILEREYNVELDELRQEGEEYYSQDNPTQKKDKKVFVTPKRNKSYTLVYLAVVAIIFVIAILFSMDRTSSVSPAVKTDVLDNKAIEDAKENIKISDPDVVFEVVDENTSIDENLTLDENLTNAEINASIEEIVEPEVILVKSFKVIAQKKLWLGYMNLKTKQKKQKIFTGEFDLDPQKDWLLSLGHGYVDVDIDGEITEFKSKYNIKLLYKDANITKISFKEYKVINEGSKW